MTHLGDIQRAVLVEGLDDWVGIWSIAREIRDHEGHVSDAELREKVVNLICHLHEAGYVRVGRPTSEGKFLAWELPPSEVAHRIVSEWSDLGRDPDLGEICWLENTERGDQLARNTASQRQ